LLTSWRFNRSGLRLGSCNALYGTTCYGGANTNGTVFKINLGGTGFQSLYSFINSNGIEPAAGLIFSNTAFYGTTSAGGNSNNGTVFKINSDGSGFSVLHFFNGTDGKEPLSRLVMGSNGSLYGTTYFGGTNNKGTVFSVGASGTGFTTIHSFSGSDGEFPAAGLALSSNTLYGTTAMGCDWTNLMGQ
jgi:uncharacterized repeat protein (TIGR03803 family)